MTKVRAYYTYRGWIRNNMRGPRRCDVLKDARKALGLSRREMDRYRAELRAAGDFSFELRGNEVATN